MVFNTKFKTSYLQAEATGGNATQMILKQNSVLEKKISELETEKEKLERNLNESTIKYSETSGSLNNELEELRAKVGDLETKLKEKEKEVSSAESRLALRLQISHDRRRIRKACFIF